MKNKKRFLALFLAAVTAFSAAACGSSSDETQSPSVGGETVGETGTEENGESGGVEAAVKYPSFSLDAIELSEGTSDSSEIDHTVWHNPEGQDYTDPEQYTYNLSLSATSTLMWNPAEWETNDDQYIVTYVTTPFWAFCLNETGDGWSIVPEMAVGYAEDVTADYVGSYGISEGDTAKAWKVTLNPDAKWEDGTPINADTYVYSWKELLDPKQHNRRADSFYAGNFQIVGAKQYYYQGQSAFTALGTTVAEYSGSTDDLYIDAYSFWNCDSSYTDADGNPAPQYVSVNDETVYGENVDDAFSGAQLYADYFAPGAAYETLAPDYVGTMEFFEDNYSWDNVGLLKTGEYEVVYITNVSVNQPEFYLAYNMPDSSFLLYEPLYESTKRFFNADGDEVSADSDDITLITTTYGTSVETTASFGPYRVAYFEADKQLTLDRNENWYGYSDGNHLGQYQTDTISIQVIAEQATELLAFQNGEIDQVALTASDMATYGSSEYIQYTPQSYTTKLTLNTDLAKTSERGTQVLTNLNFRKAFSLAIDRTTFAQSYTAAGAAGYGILNYMYVYDPTTGETYRDSDAAKKALVDLYGLTYGEDGIFDDLDEAYDSITGYDLAQAQELMELAYEQVTSDGTWDGVTPINLTLSVYGTDDTYVQMFNFLHDALAAAIQGTGFEGKLEMVMKADADYYNSAYSGETDIIFSTWGGSAYDPFGVLYECYCDGADGSQNQMEYGFDTSQVSVTIPINGHEFTQSLQTWALYADNDAHTVLTSNDGELTLPQYSSLDGESRCAIFAAGEYVYLANFVNMPLYYRQSATLNSQKVNFASDSYIDIIGFDTVQSLSYNYSDAEWANVKGTLSY